MVVKLAVKYMVDKLAVVVVEPLCRLSLPEVEKNDWSQVMYLKYVSKLLCYLY